MARLEPQNDPISFMSFLTNSHRTVAIMTFPKDMGWGEAMDIMNDALNDVIPGDDYFFLSLGNEDLLTDTSAEYILRTETEEDRLKAEAFMFNFKIQWPG